MSVVSSLADVMPGDTVYGAGNWCIAGRSGPAATGADLRLDGLCLPAVGAKALQPERDIVAFAGDGCFMNAARNSHCRAMPVIVVVVDNGMRHHPHASGREYPGRTIGNTGNQFCHLARAMATRRDGA
jgi:thiamine pyrophosphate-dependent acetolactate synthase large subunit-like protein